jgi:hypothetical protein
LPAYISKLGSIAKFICGVMDKAMAIKLFRLSFIGKDLREGLPDDADAS